MSESWQSDDRPAAVSERPAYETDPWFYRTVVIALGLSATGSVIGIVLLAPLGKSSPEALVALGSGAVGALAGVFSK